MSDTSASDMNRVSPKATRVLDAAKRLFIERGYGATQMDAIAADAGVSKATVYAYYESKKTLFAATARRECQRMTVQMAIPTEVETLPLETALQRIAHSFLRAAVSAELVALLRMVIAEVPRFPELGAIFYASAPGLTLQGVTDYMRGARTHGLIAATDCELAATQFLGMLRGDLHLRLLLGQPVDKCRVQRVADESVRLFLARYAA